ncbi:MAG: hypothetical protein KF708_15250 [Pirellulales bacterium]|nr:hypothetical protein [Pirellulales bacterium]
MRASTFSLLLCGFSLSALAHADEPAAATEQQIREAVQKAIGYEQAESASWMSTRGCASCHHLPMVLWSLNEAERQGYAIDKKYVTDMAETAFGSPQALVASKQIPEPGSPPGPRPVDNGVRVVTAFTAVAARSYPSLTDGQRQALQAIAAGLVEKQRADGGWDCHLRRPPINESETTDGAWNLMALYGETGPDSPEPQRAALDKALTWWSGLTLPDNLQDKVLKILVELRLGKSRDQLQSTVDELLALQQPEGGWRQNAEMPTDAYATGQTLYALALVGYTADRPEIRRAIDFLVAKQQPDGSWPMTSHASNDGSPGGSSKLLTPIQCGTASWVVLALSRLVPNEP